MLSIFTAQRCSGTNSNLVRLADLIWLLYRRVVSLIFSLISYFSLYFCHKACANGDCTAAIGSQKGLSN